MILICILVVQLLRTAAVFTGSPTKKMFIYTFGAVRPATTFKHVMILNTDTSLLD